MSVSANRFACLTNASVNVNSSGYHKDTLAFGSHCFWAALQDTSKFPLQLPYLHCIQSQLQVRLLHRVMGVFNQLLFGRPRLVTLPLNPKLRPKQQADKPFLGHHYQSLQGVSIFMLRDSFFQLNSTLTIRSMLFPGC